MSLQNLNPNPTQPASSSSANAMLLLQASTLSLLPPSPSSLKPSSLLFDPASQSLALLLSDSSILLFPSFSPLSLPPPPPPPLSIPPISTSFCFSSLNPSPSPASAHSLFLSASPSPSSSLTLLRAWIRRAGSDLYSPVALSFKGELGGRSRGLAVGLRHGFGVKIAGSVNVLVVHAAAEAKIWVLGLRMVAGEEEERVDLVKCAVIDCTRPVFEVRVSMGFLVLGEVDGVRVFLLRPMVKGGQVRRKKKKKEEGNAGDEGLVHGKLRTLKLRQDSGDFNSFFVTTTNGIVQDAENYAAGRASIKAVSICILSQKKFLILDSVGDLYLLIMQNTVTALETTDHSYLASIHRLDVTMKVQLLAVLPDLTAKMQIVWICDGSHSVHVMSVADIQHPTQESDKNKNIESTMQISAIQVIFTSEKVQDIMPVSANSILLLGQGSIFSYCIA